MTSAHNSSNGTGLGHAPTRPEYHVEPFALMVMRLCFETAVSLVGLFGNIMVCVVLAKKKKQKKSAINYYLFNLALADIGVVFVIFPLAVLLEQRPGYWPFGRFVCLYVYPVIDTFYGASIWFIAAVAIERYVIIARIQCHCRLRCEAFKLGARSSVYAVWMASFLVVSLPLFLVIEYQNGFCFINWPERTLEQFYTLVLVFFCFVSPLAIVCWTYFQITKRLRKSSQFLKSLKQKSSQGTTSDGSRNSRLKENIRARRILSPIVVAFAITMLPLNLFRVVSVYWPSVYTLAHFWTLYKILIIFTVSNSATNPIIYLAVSQEFRRAFAKMFLKSSQRLRSLKRTAHKCRRPAYYGTIRFTPEHWPRPHTLRETIL